MNFTVQKCVSVWPPSWKCNFFSEFWHCATELSSYCMKFVLMCPIIARKTQFQSCLMMNFLEKLLQVPNMQQNYCWHFFWQISLQKIDIISKTKKKRSKQGAIQTTSKLCIHVLSSFQPNTNKNKVRTFCYKQIQPMKYVHGVCRYR